MNDIQRYFVEEFAEEYHEGHLSPRELLRRVLLISRTRFQPVEKLPRGPEWAGLSCRARFEIRPSPKASAQIPACFDRLGGF